MDLGKRHVWLMAWMVSVPLLWFGYSREPGQDQVKAIQVQVEMVSLPVVVTSRDGKRITDLQKADFRIFEDKVEQELAGFSTTEEPISVALILDTSGSMQRKIRLLHDEAIRFVNLLNPEDEVAVLSFSDEVTLLRDFTADRKRIASGIRLTDAGGGTALYEAVSLGLDQVLKPVRERKAIVLFTDGVDTVSRAATRKSTLKLARESDAAIYSIYFNTEEDFAQVYRPGRFTFPYPVVLTGMGIPVTSIDYYDGKKYLKQLAEQSGGLFYDALTTRDLGPAFEEIARELASQYSLGYYPANPKHDGKFHKITVKVNRPDAVVRTKKGYVLPKP